MQISESQIKFRQTGQSLFELVVAIAISALVIIAIVSLVTNSLRNATFSRNNAQAVSFAQSATEWLRTERDTSIAVFLTYATTPNGDYRPSTTYCLPDLSWDHYIESATPTSCDSFTIPTTPFIRKVVFTDKTPPAGKTLIQTDVSVTWSDTQGTHEVTDSTNFTDWRQR